jgi:hypothetical protein
LNWVDASEPAKAWGAKANAEQLIQQKDARDQLLKDSDVQGL